MDYKNQFVDENSYLAYADKPDTAYDGSGGGGGGVLTIELEEQTANKKTSEILNAINSGCNVAIKSDDDTYFYLTSWIAIESYYDFIFGDFLTINSTDLNDYPTVSIS